MLKLMTTIAFVAAIAIAATAYAISSSSADRAVCPGKIVCPLTGDLVCKDRCPLDSEPDVANADTPSCCASGSSENNATRADCPGRIECPLTGEFVCTDRCPVGEQAASDQTVELPACAASSRSGNP